MTSTTRILLCGLAVASLAGCGGGDSSPSTSPSATTPPSSSAPPATIDPSSTAPAPAPTSAAPTSGMPTSAGPTSRLECSPTAVKGATGLTLAQAKTLVGKSAPGCTVYKQGTPGFMAFTLAAADTKQPGWAETAAVDGKPVAGKTPNTDPRRYVEVDGAWHEYRVWN